MVARLLDALGQQAVTPDFFFDIVVVDNDVNRSSEEVVQRFARNAQVKTTYECEPEQNISVARNRAIRCSTGNLVGLIDDDEYPPVDWLKHLYLALNSYGATGVLGPVVADFPDEAPAWLKKGDVFRRRRLATGVRIAPGDGRSGNVLVRRSSFTEDACWFDPAFGRTGGEDSDFFRRQFGLGRQFIWCDEAAVHETIPPERWKVSYHVKRLLQAGTLDGELMRAGKLPSSGIIAKNVVIFCACATLIPLAVLVLPRHRWIRLAQKFAYSGGLVSAFWGYSILRHRG